MAIPDRHRTTILFVLWSGQNVSLIPSCNHCLGNTLERWQAAVAKEYCAARTDNDGVPILSEFAGATTPNALLVNPNHTAEVARTLKAAFEMSFEEQQVRMRQMRAKIRKEDIFTMA